MTVEPTLKEENVTGEDHHDKNASTNNSRKTCILVVAGVLVVAIALGVTLGVILGTDDDDSAPSETVAPNTPPPNSPTSPPTLSPVFVNPNTFAPTTQRVSPIDFGLGFNCSEPANGMTLNQRDGGANERIGFVDNGSGVSCLLQMTKTEPGVFASAFLSSLLNQGVPFRVQLQYRIFGSGGGAGGIAFVMHQDARGANALGEGDLGYFDPNGIQKSMAVYLRIEPDGTERMGFAMSGDQKINAQVPVRQASASQVGELTLTYCPQNAQVVARNKVDRDSSTNSLLVGVSFNSTEVWNHTDPLYVGFTSFSGSFAVVDSQQVLSLILSTAGFSGCE